MARLTSIRIRDFKSYRDATLRLAPVTLLVGANASGKSNALEALQMLAWLARGRRLDEVFRAVQDSEVQLRGRMSDLTRHDENSFHFGCSLLNGKWSSLDIRIEVGDDGLRVGGESLSAEGHEVPLYHVQQPPPPFGGSLTVAYNNFSRGKNKPHIACNDQQAVFTQLITPARFGATHKFSQEFIPKTCNALIAALSNVVFLDPVPHRMRLPSFPQDKVLRGDGSNLSSVLHRICAEEQGKSRVLQFIRELPEQNFTDVRFADGARGEVLIELQESFGGRSDWRDAGVLSDGTLRVLSVAAAMLSAIEGSTVVIEEIDNGVHPSRAGALLSALDEVARRRNLSVLLTSHNPALLDALPNRALPDVVFCYRDPDEGDSRLVKLDKLPNYPELVSRGPLGRLVTQGILDRVAKNPVSREEKMAAGLSYVEQLKNAE